MARDGTLCDPAALQYLISLPKLGALPPDVRMTNGLSFDAKFFGNWGSLGRMQVAVSNDGKVLSLAYFKSLFSDTSFSFMLIDSNAPAKVQQLLDFLLGHNGTTGSHLNL
jgi:hypothetical protein